MGASTPSLRQFLGHADIWDKRKYEYQTVVDNVCLVRPELLAAGWTADSGERPCGREKKAWRAVARAL